MKSMHRQDPITFYRNVVDHVYHYCVPAEGRRELGEGWQIDVA